MTVQEAIQLLQQHDPKKQVYFVSSHGCEECNSEAMPYYDEICDIRAVSEGSYPHNDLKDIVVIA